MLSKDFFYFFSKNFGMIRNLPNSQYFSEFFALDFSYKQ